MMKQNDFRPYTKIEGNYAQLMDFLDARDYDTVFFIKTDFRTRIACYQIEKDNWVLLDSDYQVIAIIDDNSIHGLASFLFEEDEDSSDELILFLGSSKGSISIDKEL